MTLRATVANRGIFWSPSREKWVNLFEWVSEPILNERLNRWTSLFTRKFPDVIESFAEEIQSELESFTEAIKQTLSENISGESLENLLDNVLNLKLRNNLATLSTLKDEISLSGSERSSELIPLIEVSIKGNMLPIVMSASLEHGKGMASRMREILTSGATETLPTTFTEVAQDLARKISEAVGTSQAILFGVSGDITKVTNDLLTLLTEEAPDEIKLDEQALGAIKNFVLSKSDVLARTTIDIEHESLDEIKSDDLIRYAYLDGSNVATLRVEGKAVASLARLLDCKASAERQFLDHKVATIIDSRFRHLLANDDERSKLKALIEEGVIHDQASGIKGGADKLILEAVKRSDGIVISNDMYREWTNQYPFLRETGRHFSAKLLSGVDEWLFLEMNVR
jgi:hypothetical protein